MDVRFVVDSCIYVLDIFSEKQPLQEFELLAYEQACRTLETVLKDFRETWETKDEFGNITK